MFKKWLMIVALVMALPLALAACGGETVEVERVVTVTEVVTEVVEREGETVTEVVTEVVTVIEEREVIVEVEREVEMVDRSGAWLDTVVIVEEPNEDASISRLIAGDLDIRGSSIASRAGVGRIVASPELDYVQNFGIYDELSFNPIGPVLENGTLNPFAVKEIREAMNWLVDREFIAQELYGGNAVPRYLPIPQASADYAELADVARGLEARYAYDKERATAAITAGMENLGAELVGGVWQYEGNPVELTFLIRGDDTRREIGDYVANELEDLGFTVVRQIGSAAELSPIWYSSDPALGQWHLYTGGWSATAVSRDLGWVYAFFYTATGQPSPLWQGYDPDPDFYDLAQRLWNNDFTTLDERREMIGDALVGAMAESQRIFLTTRIGATPFREGIAVTYDLFGGVSGGALWANTLRYDGQIGGSMRVGLPSILTEPWNPVAGSNWLFDAMIYRGIGEQGVVTDPYTGLAQPLRIERAEIVAEEGLPISKTLDWVSLEFVPEIVVPDDAWVDWDAAEQRFLTASEVYTQPVTSLYKSTVYYPADFFDTVSWHDGSPISVGDFVMAMIITFDRAKEESAIFDPVRVAPFNTFMAAFNGLRIVSEDPLIIEHYGDNYSLDAELMTNSWFPYYAQGPGAWHNIALGYYAEANGLAVFSQAKSTAQELDRLNYIAGETVAVLKGQLDAAIAEDYALPYAPTLGQFVSAEEAEMRYNNLNEWHRRRGHFWLGTGVFYLERAFPVEGTVILQRFPTHPDSATRWLGFAAPAIAEVEVDGPNRVTIGSEEVFDVFVDFAGQPYAMDDILGVKFLVINAEGDVVAVGEADAVEDGLWEIVLTSDITSNLEAGSYRLEAVVVSRLVAMPSFDSLLFVAAP
jgi:peptide/nickel transport system substrate-binding protein